MLMVDRKLFQQGDQIGQNFTIWAIFYGIGWFFLEKIAQWFVQNFSHNHPKLTLIRLKFCLKRGSTWQKNILLTSKNISYDVIGKENDYSSDVIGKETILVDAECHLCECRYAECRGAMVCHRCLFEEGGWTYDRSGRSNNSQRFSYNHLGARHSA